MEKYQIPIYTYMTIADMKTVKHKEGVRAWCRGTKTEYIYLESGAAFTPDDQKVLTTGGMGTHRWVGISGQYSNWAGGGGGTPAGTQGAVQYNEGGAFGGDATKLLWTHSPDRLSILKRDGGGIMPSTIVDGNCILSLMSTGNATNFWFAVPAAGATNATFGFVLGGAANFKHAMTYMVGADKLVLTPYGAMGTPSDGLYVDAAANVSVGDIAIIPTKFYVGGTAKITGDTQCDTRVDIGTYDRGSLNDHKRFLLTTDNVGIGRLTDGTYIGSARVGEECWEAGDIPIEWYPKIGTVNQWWPSAISGDGKYMTVGEAGGLLPLYRSEDYGKTFTATTSALGVWTGLSMSADGKIQSACMFGGLIYNSYDYGVTWAAAAAPGAVWYCNAMSSDGRVIAAGISGGFVYVSKDFGLTWTPGNTSMACHDIAISSDGKFQFVATGGGATRSYISDDYGATWYSTTLPVADWRGAAMSHDGKIVLTCAFSGEAYVSYDYGAHWSALPVPSLGYFCAAMSENGRIQMIGVYFGVIYVSYDYGVTWAIDETRPNFSNNRSISLSYDAKIRLLAVDSQGAFVSETGSRLRHGNLGIDTPLATHKFTIGGIAALENAGKNQAVLSIDNLQIGQLEGGAYVGGVGVEENTWALKNYGKSVTTVGPTPWWFATAMSSDGKYQTAVPVSDFIYVSSDYGKTWASKGISTGWFGVAMSADGRIQTAIDQSPGFIYCSYDYGQTWTSKGISGQWRSVAMSSDGRIQVAVIYSGGALYISTNFGEVWTAKIVGTNFLSVAVSSDGKIITVANTGGQLYVSTTQGVTWTQRDSVRGWEAVAMSKDGRIQTAVVSGGDIYASYDYGTTWTVRVLTRNWMCISMSADGMIQVATTIGDDVYLSEDYGVTWNSLSLGSKMWYGCSMSSDGKTILLGPASTNLYLLKATVYQNSDTHLDSGVSYNVKTITLSTILDSTYHIILCNAAGPITVTLPAAASNTNRIYKIKNINTGTVTIDANLAETIDGVGTYLLTTQWSSITICCNGAAWFII